MTTRLIIAPTSEPVTLAEAKTQLRIDHSDEDALIQSLITSAREMAEQITRRSIMPQTWEKTVDSFLDNDIELLNPAVTAIEYVKYLDPDGVEQVLSPSDYYLDKDNEPAWLLLGVGKEWPKTAEAANAIRVRYTAGYTDVPSSIKVWILLAIEHLYDRCKSGESASLSEGFAKHLLDRFIVWG